MAINILNYIKSIVSDGINNITLLLNPNENRYEFPISFEAHICTDNTTSDNLGAGEAFTGEWQNTLNYVEAIVNVNADQDSAVDGLVLQHSYDGITVDNSEPFTIYANNPKKFSSATEMKFFRIIYTNGTTPTTSLTIVTRLNRVRSKPSSHRINDSIVGQDDAELVKTVNTGLSPDGTFKNVNVTLDGDLLMADNSSGLAISRGDVTGSDYLHKFGNAPDFDTTDGQVTIWDGAEDGATWELMNYVYSTTADIDRISSSNNSDTQPIKIYGLDGDYNKVIQTITLTGQTPAPLTTPLLRVYRMENDNDTDLLGHVFCFVNVATTLGVPNTPANIRAIIQDSNNQTLMSIYTVAAGETAYLEKFWASIAGANKSSNYVIDLYIRNQGKVFQLKNRNSISDNGTSFLPFQYKTPVKIPEKSDIELRVTALAVGVTAASISGGFDLVIDTN